MDLHYVGLRVRWLELTQSCILLTSDCSWSRSCCDFSIILYIEKHVICKEIEGTPFRELVDIMSSIYIDEEKEGTEDGTLRHSRNHSFFSGCSTVNYNMLPPVG